MELVVHVLDYRLRRSGDASLDEELSRMRNKTLGASATAYQQRGANEEAVEAKGSKSKYKSLQSKDGKFFAGASFRCDLDPRPNPLVSGVKLCLFAVNGLEIIDIGSCRWRPEASSSSLLGRGYQVTATLDVASNSRNVGKVTCSISIVRAIAQARGHEEEKHVEYVDQIPVPQLKFRAFTTNVNWNRVCAINLKQVVDEADGEALLTCQRDVATGDLSQEQVDPLLRKPMELASYTVQYLGSVLELLQHRQSLIVDASKTFQEEEDALDMHLAKLRARETALQRECDSLDETRRDFCSLLQTLDPHLAREYNDNHRSREHRDDYKAEVASRRAKAAEFRTDFDGAAQAEVDATDGNDDCVDSALQAAASPTKSENGGQPSSSPAWASQRATHDTSPSSPGSFLRPAALSSSPIKQQQLEAVSGSAAYANGEDDMVVLEGASAGFSSRKYSFKQDREDDVDLPMQASLSLRASMHGMTRASQASSVMSVDSLGFGMFARQSTAEALRGQSDMETTDLVEAFRIDTDSDDDAAAAPQAVPVLAPPSPSPPPSSSASASSSPKIVSAPPATANDAMLDLEDFDDGPPRGDDEDAEEEEEEGTNDIRSFQRAEHDDVFEHAGSGNDSEEDALPSYSYSYPGRGRHKASILLRDDSVEVDLTQLGVGGTVTASPDEDEDDDVVLFGTGGYRGSWES